jgi:hypothetical protein
MIRDEADGSSSIVMSAFHNAQPRARAHITAASTTDTGTRRRAVR